MGLSLDQKIIHRDLSRSSHSLTTNRRDLFINSLVVVTDQCNFVMEGQINLLLR